MLHGAMSRRLKGAAPGASAAGCAEVACCAVRHSIERQRCMPDAEPTNKHQSQVKVSADLCLPAAYAALQACTVLPAAAVVGICTALYLESVERLQLLVSNCNQ
jgi:hypothetical protein